MDWPTIASFTQAGATLLTGVAAVAGAVWIGFKQVAITKRQVEIADSQTAILAQQVQLERKRLDHDLYEKRYEAFEATTILLAEMMGGIEPVQEKTKNRFLVAMTESVFLFDETVHPAMKELWAKCVDQEYLRKKMFRDHDATGAYAEADPDKEYAINTWIAHRYATIQDLFGQLRLG